MKQVTSSLLIAAAAFAAGLGAARLPQAASAAAAPVVARTIDLEALTPSDFPTENPALPGIRQMTLAATDGMAINAQYITTAGKHTHDVSNEFQVVLSGNGTEVVGDKPYALRPGTFVEVPIGTIHAGLTGGPFVIVSIKAPPPAPGDYHPVP